MNIVLAMVHSERSMTIPAAEAWKEPIAGVDDISAEKVQSGWYGPADTWTSKSGSNSTRKLPAVIRTGGAARCREVAKLAKAESELQQKFMTVMLPLREYENDIRVVHKENGYPGLVPKSSEMMGMALALTVGQMKAFVEKGRKRGEGADKARFDREKENAHGVVRVGTTATIAMGEDEYDWYQDSDED
jgi:hypothetical protein